MSTLEDLDDLERHEKEEKKDDDKKKDGEDGKKADGDAEMKDAEPEEEQLDEEILNSSTRDIQARRRLLENDMRIMKSEFQRLTHEKATMNEKIKDNLEKIENNRYVLQVRGVAPQPHVAVNLTVTHVQKATSISRRQRCRNTRSRRHSRSRGRGRKHRSGCNSRRQICRHQDIDEADHLPAPHRPRRP